ncbi:50S ribosomal protein L11 methyltransferase [Pontibacter sp. JAM-7]|uniref:50S ribosomal protein L11 methyltransferase n=1 Tax=Pontibacter sp. JAM-7 TaxID=3366581 RepID=UPI003AF65D6D
MSWLQIKIEIHPDQAEIFEDLLLSAGCAAVTLQDSGDQPIFEPELGTTPLWQSTTITGLFSAEHNLEMTLDYINKAQQQLLPNQPAAKVKAEILEDKDWVRAWMDEYHPMQFGQRLWICPSWCDVPDPDAVNLMLDPGLAFGTGTHPTTALCLEWLDSQPLDGKAVIDFGCGSGILGIAALLLGAQQATGIDIDPQALQASRDNVQRNQVDASRFQVFLPDDAPPLQADALVANILAGPLVSLAATLAEQVKPEGLLCLSGLLAHQDNELRAAYAPWFELEPTATKEGWIRITGRRKTV